ncbi:MAG: hypothetical protein ABW123_06605, partial [Cystobacter sp.]
MVGRVMGLMMLGCVLGSTACGKAKATQPTEAPAPVTAQAESAAPVVPVKTAEAKPEAVAPAKETRPAQEGIALQESQTKEAPAAQGETAQPRRADADRLWLSESAEAARASNTNISPDTATEEITIASGTVDGRVKRVRGRTIEVSDGEGNVYELRIDGRSRGLRQGR